MAALSQGAVGKTAVTPRFHFPIGTRVAIEGLEYDVLGRVGDGRWQLQSEDRETKFRSDAQLAELMRTGEFYVDRECGMRVFAPPPPLSPLLVGPKAHEKNQRKHDYVLACLNAPGGFSRSRLLLNPIIEAVAAGKGEKAPGFTTVLSWIAEWEVYGEQIGTAAYSDRHDLKGRRRDILQSWQEEAITVGIDAWPALRSKVRAYALVCEFVAEFDRREGHRADKGSLGPQFVDDEGKLRPPSRRTFERRCSLVDRFEQDWSLKGPAFAKQRNRTYQTTPRPDRPYAEVEVDHTRVDLLVLDDERGFILGRPNLTVFRDRATAMILGYGLGFEDPSYAAFVQGLRHAIYPKGPPLSEHAKNDWPCFGRFENLFTDNGLEFIGSNMDAAARQLGFNRIPLRPRQPWLKGAIERWFRSLGVGLLRSLPGATLSNVLERKDHEHLGEATLTLSEFEALLDWWIRDVYHASPTKGLGFIRGFGGVPLEEWAARARQLPTPLLPHPDLLMSLAGDSDSRTIQNNGITWDHIIYESPDLWALRSHPKHRRRGESGGPTLYDVFRDPFDLGSITVIDPYEKRPIRIPATAAHQAYADGLTLHQHEVIVAHARRERGRRQKLAIEDLLESQATLARVAVKLSNTPSRKKVRRLLSRYLNVEQSLRHRSQITLLAPTRSSSGFIDFTASESDRPEPLRSEEALPFVDQGVDDASDDLDELRQSRNWSVYSD